MFRRKEDGMEIETTEGEATTASSESKSESRTDTKVEAPRPAGLGNAPAAPAAAGFRPVPPQAAFAANRAASPMPAASAPIPAAASPERAMTKGSAKRVLTVGPDIQMKGEIMTCDRVVIEGAVDATLREVHTVELAESGSLKGMAEVQDAEISGVFEGDLLVRGRLIIYSTGKVRGNVTYGEIEIERGGQISGNIRNVSDSEKDNLGKRRAA
jgi:cytoskeletal protein CcmA (bactofilin family)